MEKDNFIRHKEIKKLNDNLKAFEYSFQNENEIKDEIFVAVIDKNNKLIDMRVPKEKEDDIFLTSVLKDLENNRIKYDKSLNFEYLIENERHFDKCFEYALTIDVFLEEHFKGKNEFLLYSKAQDILIETFKNSDTNEISEIDKKTIEIAFLKEYENNKEYDLDGNSVLNLSKIDFESEKIPGHPLENYRFVYLECFSQGYFPLHFFSYESFKKFILKEIDYSQGYSYFYNNYFRRDYDPEYIDGLIDIKMKPIYKKMFPDSEKFKFPISDKVEYVF